MDQPEIITREEARIRELKRYYTGIPCVNGHLTHRFVSNGACLDCQEKQRVERLGRKPRLFCLRCSSRLIVQSGQALRTYYRCKACKAKHVVPKDTGELRLTEDQVKRTKQGIEGIIPGARVFVEGKFLCVG